MLLYDRQNPNANLDIIPVLMTLSGFIVLTSVDVLTALFAVYDLHTNRYNNSMMLLTTQCTAAATINSKTSNNSMFTS